IDLYYWTTPNGHKITMFLEETGLPYKIVPVNISKGDQFKPEFLAISPNNRIPAIVDHTPKDGGKPISVFESGAILLYLAEKTGLFLYNDSRRKIEVIRRRARRGSTSSLPKSASAAKARSDRAHIVRLRHDPRLCISF